MAHWWHDRNRAVRAPLDSMGGGGGGVPISTAPGTNLIQPWTQQQLQANAAATAGILATATPYDQVIGSGTVTPAMGSPQVITANVVNVGLIRKFRLELTCTITNPAGGNLLTRTPLAPFNLISNFTYQDPQNYQRINTPGWHLAFAMARRHRRVPASAVLTDSPSGFGSVLTPMQAPPAIAPGQTGTVSCIFEIPLSFSQSILDGAVYAGVNFATQTLQFTFAPNIVQAGTDPIAACYTGAATTAGNIPTMTATWRLYQDYLDGFNLGLLPLLTKSLSTLYSFKTTAFTALLANNDNYFRFANLQTFLSTFVLYDNNGVMNPGTDITYFKLQAANQTTLWQRYMATQSLFTRNRIGDDYPMGCYLFDFSEQPIITAAEGNTTLIMNPSTAPAGAFALVAWESLATSAVLASAPMLQGSAGA